MQNKCVIYNFYSNKYPIVYILAINVVKENVICTVKFSPCTYMQRRKKKRERKKYIVLPDRLEYT